MTKLSNQTLKAKALYEIEEDMVAFFKTKYASQWSQLLSPSFANNTTEYFVCHESNKEACLHWLNGGDVMIYTVAGYVDLVSRDQAIMNPMMNLFANKDALFKIKAEETLPLPAPEPKKKHKHIKLISTKAANMDLVTLIKSKIGSEWIKANDQDSTNFDENYEFFLCHKKHVDVCLHWLNGGDVTGVSDEWSTKDAMRVFCNPEAGLAKKPKKKTYAGIYRIDGVGLVIGDECESKDDVVLNQNLLKIIEL